MSDVYQLVKRKVFAQWNMIVLAIIISCVVFYLSYHQLGGCLDLGVYLASTRALLTRQNAWNDVQLTAIAHTNGYLNSGIKVFGLWTPPTALLLLIPLTLVPFPIAMWLWIFINVLLLFSIYRILHTWLPSMSVSTQIVLGLLFPPLTTLLLWGQISGFVLLGYILFIYFSQRNIDLLAGLSLLLITFKPHLGFLVWIFLSWWVLKQHRWRIALGFGVGLLLCLGLIFLIHPSWLTDYRLALSVPPLQYEASSIFRMLYKAFLPDQPWVQFSGLIVSSFSLIVFLLLRRRSMDLLPTIPLLLLFSVVFAPYGWIYDQIVTLPAFIWLAHELFQKSPAWWVWSVLLIPSMGYYYQIWGSWGNNDPRLFWFPLLLAVVFSAMLWTRRSLGPVKE